MFVIALHFLPLHLLEEMTYLSYFPQLENVSLTGQALSLTDYSHNDNINTIIMRI